MIMHNITLTNGEASMLTSVLSIPETFTTPSEILRVGALLENLEVKLPADEATLPEWVKQPFDIVQLTEAQRELCKSALTKHASKLPVGAPHVRSLLQMFGFD